MDAPYKFAHDRVQQAAYSLIEEENLSTRHFQIGKILLENASKEDMEEKVFDIVNHLNYGVELITAEKEKLELADLNLRAGRRAKLSIAYESALRYLTTGLSLLPEESWSRHYDLVAALHMELAEAEFLNGHLEEADTLFKTIIDKVKTTIEKAKVYCLHVDLYMVLSKPAEALRVGLDGLSLLQHAAITRNKEPECIARLTEMETKA